MKFSLLTVTFLCTVALTSFAQFRKIPSEVTEAFRKKFPDAEEVSWKDKLTSFQASFQQGEDSFTATFSADGEWEETARKSSFEDLPNDVKEGFEKSKYAEWQTRDIYVIEKKREDLFFCLFVMKSAIQKKYLYFNSNGQLKREKISL